MNPVSNSPPRPVPIRRSLSIRRRPAVSSKSTFQKPPTPVAERRERKSPLHTTLTQPEARAFLLHLASERGLATNSLSAYRRDLEDIDRWFNATGRQLLTAGPEDFRQYLQNQSRRGQSTRTVSRRLAAIRIFTRFLSDQPQHTQRV